VPYKNLWKDLATTLSNAPPADPPILGTVSFSDSPVISAALAVQKLPSFILVQDGYMHGSNISSPSLDGLLYIANADWAEFSEKSKKPVKDPTRHAILNMKSFEIAGSMAYSTQERIVAWINRDRTVAYTTIGVILALAVLARRYGYLNIY
jgi:hypothetical protein